MKTFTYSVALLLVAMTLQSCNLLSAAGISSQGQPTKKVEGKLVSTTENSAVNVDHSAWDLLLQKYVSKEGLVNYKGFKKDSESLQSYLDMLSQLDPSNDWSVQELLSYYINLYNAHTVNLIVENYPVKSIKDINGAWTKGIAKVDGRELSLGGIENGILRKMNEPRIHFAINCASISCPKLLNEAYTSAKINEQLTRVTGGFMSSDKNEIMPNAPKLSSIFNWYKKDFTINGEVDVIAYINKYSRSKMNDNAVITYKEYDWGLNDQQ